MARSRDQERARVATRRGRRNTPCRLVGKMKILLLCWRDSTHPQGGGSERYLERVGEYLARQGHEVVYRTAGHTDAPRRSHRNGVRYSRSGGKFTVYPRAWV